MRKRAVGQKGEKKPLPNNETRNAIKEVELAKGIKLKDSQELFSKLGIKYTKMIVIANQRS